MIHKRNLVILFSFQVSELFLTNYEKFVAGEKMDYVVDWGRGY